MTDEKRAQNAPKQEQNKGSENLSNEQASVNNIDQLQRYKSGDYLNKVGSLEYAPANDVLMAASLEPAPQSLWGDGMIFENEVTCIFSDSGTGKSILAVQVADEIARKGRVVLYVDFELSKAQFRTRYTNDNAEDYEFSPNFLRCNVQQYSLIGDDIISDIKSACADSGASVVIIDNLTWIESNAEKGDAAALLMQELVEMKRAHGLTVIVISHTPKRYLNQPITQNDLSGSKKILNFLDAAITIGKSIKDPALRYIKQIKCRTAGFKYDSDNVLVCELTHGERGNFLHHEPVRTAAESELLQSIDEDTRAMLVENVRELTNKGRSQREIAKELGISKSTVVNYQKRMRNEDID